MIIQKKSLADMVAEQLRRQITEGVYTIGDKLPTEPALMKTFKVGRSSIREAVKLLVNMGVVQVRQGAGTFVAEASDANGGSINMSIADRTELDEVRKYWILQSWRKPWQEEQKRYRANAVLP